MPDVGIAALVRALFNKPDAEMTLRDLAALGVAGDLLRYWGALVEVERPATVLCEACDEDHPVEPEYDAITRSYRHYCGSSGWMDVDPQTLRLFRLDHEWLCARLAEGLAIARPRVRDLVPGVLYDLGDASLGGRLTSIFLAREVDRHLDPILEALRTRGGTFRGLVLTGSPGTPWTLDLPFGHRFTQLEDVVEVRNKRLAISRETVSRALAGRRKEPGARPPGRPTEKDIVLETFNRRRKEGWTLPTLRAEARAIADDLFREQGQEHKHGTIENQIRVSHRAWREASPRSTK